MGAKCPQLSKRNHGKHEIHQELPEDAEGNRRRFRRTGYADVKSANTDLDRIRAILDLAGEDRNDQRRVGDLLSGLMRDRAKIPDASEVKRKLGVGIELDGKTTLAEWLDKWMSGKKTRDTTNRSYRSHIEHHIKPHLGHLRLDRISVAHVQAMFDAIDEQNETAAAENAARRAQIARCKRDRPGVPKVSERATLAAERARLAAMPPFRRITGPATQQAIRRTLRAALNKAISTGAATFNGAKHVELDGGRRPDPLLWTPNREARWRETGEIPGPVMVWRPEHVGAFLDAADGSRLYPLFHLIVFAGLRRGEAVGMRWMDVDFDEQTVTVAKELVVGDDGWTPAETEPKTKGSVGEVGIDAGTVAVLRAHRERQAQEKKAAGKKWADTGNVFVTENGEWLHPEKVSAEFRRLVQLAGVPPVNLRDARHVAATLTHAGGGDIHTVSKRLRHSTIVLTSNTYTSLLKEVDLDVAERAAALVPRQGRHTPVRPADGEAASA